MKKINPKSITFRYTVICTVLLGAILVVFSCKKDRKGQSDDNNIDIGQAKSWYESSYSTDKLGRNLNKSQNSGNPGKLPLFTIINPNWKLAVSYTRFNKKTIEIPLDSTAKLGYTVNANSYDINRNYSKSSFLILNDGKNYSAYIMTILADSSYLNNDFTKLNLNSYSKRDKVFSGYVFYSSPEGTLLKGWHYLNGVINKAVITNSGSITLPPVKQQTTGLYKQRNLDAGGCTTILIQAYISTSCITVVTSTSCTDNYTQQMETICSNGGGGGFPGDGGGGGFPGDGGGGGGGGLGGAPGFPDPTDVTTTAPLTLPDPVDPCVQKAAISAQAANSVISAKNATILSNTNADSNHLEYGYNQNLSSFPGINYLNSPITPGISSDTWIGNFTWDSVNGYSIGSAHIHPGGTAPSSDDVFAMVANLNNFALTSAGTTAINFYMANVSTTIVTNNGTFVVTINDWSQIQDLFNTFNNNKSVFDTNVQTIASQYKATNPTVSDAVATSYALLTTFGSSINLYYAPANSTTYKPLITDSSNLVSFKTCPSN